VGKSRRIIENYLADLSAYVNEADITYEGFRELPEALEGRQIGRRIALYSESEDVITNVEDKKAADSTQRYGIDISIDRGYRNDDASAGEFPAIDLKDKVVDWLRGVDAFTVSDGAMQSMGYDGSSGFVRRKRYITLTLRASGLRDVLTTQSED